MKILNLMIFVLFLAGCSTFGDRLAPPFYLCEEPKQLLICSDASLSECEGFLKEPAIIKEKDL